MPNYAKEYMLYLSRIVLSVLPNLYGEPGAHPRTNAAGVTFLGMRKSWQ
jgi:hypothetical protein